MRKLELIASYTEMMQSLPTGSTLNKPLKICRYCNKADLSEEFQASLMRCSRCLTVFYCSKECQQKDWRAHEKRCKPGSKSDTKLSHVYQQVVLNFAQSNYVCIIFVLLCMMGTLVFG